MPPIGRLVVACHCRAFLFDFVQVGLFITFDKQLAQRPWVDAKDAVFESAPSIPATTSEPSPSLAPSISLLPLSS